MPGTIVLRPAIDIDGSSRRTPTLWTLHRTERSSPVILLLLETFTHLGCTSKEDVKFFKSLASGWEERDG